MEHTALITKTARDLGMVKELPPAEAIKLRSMGLKRYGGPPSAVEKADSACTDLPPACTGCSGCANPRPSGVGPENDLKMARITQHPIQKPAPDPRLNEMVETLVSATMQALKK